MLRKKNFQEISCNTEYWSLMVDKGYIGASQYLPVIIPMKGNNLTSQEIKNNKKISSARIVCENFYGRMKFMWGAARLKIRSDLAEYEDLNDICVSLTNYHIMEKPLRVSDGEFMRKWRAKSQTVKDMKRTSISFINYSNESQFK